MRASMQSVKPVVEAESFKRAVSYLEKWGASPNFEVLKGLEGIVASADRGVFGIDEKEAEFFRVIRQLYKSSYDISQSFEEIRDIQNLRKPSYLSFLAELLWSLSIKYEALLNGHEELEFGKLTHTDIRDLDEKTVIPEARGKFSLFSEYFRKALVEGKISREMANALKGIANIYEMKSRTKPVLKQDYLFFRFASTLAEHQLNLRLLFENIQKSKLHEVAERYHFTNIVLDNFVTNAFRLYSIYR